MTDALPMRAPAPGDVPRPQRPTDAAKARALPGAGVACAACAASGAAVGRAARAASAARIGCDVRAQSWTKAGRAARGLTTPPTGGGRAHVARPLPAAHMTAPKEHGHG
jgi:hypothetical protein